MCIRDGCQKKVEEKFRPPLEALLRQHMVGVQLVVAVDKRPDHWANLVRPIVARFSPCELSATCISATCELPATVVQVPVGRRRLSDKSHHDEDGDESFHLCDVNICECFLDLLIRIRILCTGKSQLTNVPEN